MYNDICFYLDFSWEHYADDQDNYLRNLNGLIRLAYIHKTQVYYSKSQLLDFTAQCEMLNSNFTKSIGNQLDILLQNSTGLRESDGMYFVVHPAGPGSHIQHKDISILKIMQSLRKNSIITFGPDNGDHSFLKIVDGDNFERITINFSNTKDSVIQAIARFGPERNFNLSDKHGENGVGEWAGESKLLCSSNRAQELLNSAIADFGKKLRLFNFDGIHATYIEFFYEGENPQNQWHAFHLEALHWNRVPNEVRKHFKHLE